MLITYNIIVVEEGFFQLGHPSTALKIGYPKYIYPKDALTSWRIK